MTFLAKDATGATIATKSENIGGEQTQEVVLRIGESGATTRVSSTNKLPVSDGGGSVSVDDNGTTISVDDGAGSITVDGTVALSTGPATARTTDSIAAAPAMDAIMDGLNARAYNYTPIDYNTSGTKQLVAPQGAGIKIRVLGILCLAGGAVNATFQSRTTTTQKIGKLPLSTNGLAWAFVGGFFETVANEGLDLVLDAAVQVGGIVVWAQKS